METGPIADFYDRYVPRQLAAGVNARHELIHDLAVDNGLRDGMRVLEIGCGVGTLTSLLARRLANGSLLAVDLSPESIEQATTRLRRYPHVRFAVADAVTAELPGPFDMIILPDVLEHVPADQHARLFGRLKALLAPAGSILVHSPDPWYSDWLRANRPERLQVVDLALHLPALVANMQAAGLALSRFQRHRIWTEEPDYMALVMRHPPAGQFRENDIKRPGIIARVRRSLSRW